MRRAIALTLALALLSGTATATPTSEKHYTDKFGIEYTVQFEEDTETVEVVVRNPTNRTFPGGFSVIIDETYSERRSEMVPAGGRKEYTFNITPGINVTRDTHTVKVSCGERPIWFKFTKDIDPSETEEYAVPEISDVSLETGVLQGRNRTFINVTGHNPSGRNWLFVVRAHTMETTGYYGLLYLPANGSNSETIPLNERPGELVAGEVRMYEDNFSSAERAFDQVEVYGRSSGETQWNHEEYVTVTPPWEDDPYSYENKSAYRDKVSPETVWESPVVWALGLLVLFGGFVVASRR